MPLCDLNLLGYDTAREHRVERTIISRLLLREASFDLLGEDTL